MIERWVGGVGKFRFSTLKSEEHTAQINKDVAKRIEDNFRADGVNLLSSTTTFEMGINIGNLQKVLLRNAPPSSANYVQRVGRAGRGADKNSVCVTICRRTKYDSDMWKQPSLMMSDVVRPPTVFIQNQIIAQKHFNAVVFAKFLREKIADEKLLGKDAKQQIRLAAFLPIDARKGVPIDWLKLFDSELYLDFSTWLDSQSEDDVFQTEAGKSLLKTLDEFAETIGKTKKKYIEVFDEIAKDIASLIYERKNLYDSGKEVGDIDRSIKSHLDGDIISVLATRGFLPRYAFPLDVVRLETGWSLWSSDSDVNLSRERGIAIAEFAPDSQVVANKQVFTSAGIYVAGKSDKPIRQWYSKCPDCEQIRTSLTQEPLEGTCEVCGRAITLQHIKPFVEPKAFSIRKERDKSQKLRQNSFVRQRASLTHFIDAVREDEFQKFENFDIALKKKGKLFRYNLGPQNKGFMLCQHCGCSEPLLTYKQGKKHKRLRAFDGKFECSNESPWRKPLAFGHSFESYCLVIRPREQCSVESVGMALRKGICRVLNLETSDIGIAFRYQANKIQAEIILYDNTPGGAGFVKETQENWTQIEQTTVELCRNCACETACYDCLKDYGNQSYHELLNRKSVGEFFSA